MGPDDTIVPGSMSQMYALLQAMCFVENGREISRDDVVEGWLLANKS